MATLNKPARTGAVEGRQLRLRGQAQQRPAAPIPGTAGQMPLKEQT